MRDDEPPFTITETCLKARMTLPEMRMRGHQLEADAIEEWLRFHGIDPCQVLLSSPLVRDPDRHQIRFQTLVEWEFLPVVDQGEAGPLPWPAVILERQP